MGFADPVCDALAGASRAAPSAAGARVHRGGTYVCIEGPQFSTRAESLLYRSWGVSVIGMTAMPEAKLAREAELPYALLALATDYDCWHATEEDVSVEAVLAVMKRTSRPRAGQSVRLPTPCPTESASPCRHWPPQSLPRPSASPKRTLASRPFGRSNHSQGKENRRDQ